MLTAYSKIHQIYHRETQKMMGEIVVLQEKVDGSQISFGKKDGELFIRSKNRDIDLDSPDQMFGPAVDVLKQIDLPEGYVFRAEYLKSPRHNTLQYDRVPEKFCIVYDIEAGDGTKGYFGPESVKEIAENCGFEVVPTYTRTLFNDVTQDMIDDLLKNTSILGGSKIEGVVIKCYDRFDSNDNVLMCKFVRPEFKEMNHGKAPTAKIGLVEEIGKSLQCEARWIKTLQHARDDGVLKGEMSDVGILMKYLNEDFEEHADEIKALLYSAYRKKIMRIGNSGFAEWYKKRLTKAALPNTRSMSKRLI